ncbi:hypothetical protein TWF102_002130 [Orbilia oligospora]|uniref:Glyoxalase-like domain-containing protein n=2 Tax=Orbilia oligospora TaxID=2813651 RepID=A0A7C8IXR1_ORBOL|nr:hypothetical protein TWF102_002130 [Orbilia oligospora]KAF3088020.1 hypothetical protein TWF706_011001 [Orbilia oligospora]KAF3115477.1 hypothetical protein TWF103_010889 [Orbilia oligospora]KAF3143830.1 hypothetical protein TWF594_004907 [Orbilia oligospora]
MSHSTSSTMASDQKVALLDHIIVLVPHAELKDPPKSLTDNFNITNGGRHADGKTENKLIVFKDGSYIELISFINDLPENRAGHWWGSKPYGIVDWAFTNQIDYKSNYEALISRLADTQRGSPGAYSYATPQLGGRIRPDGVKLEWAVTFPTKKEGEDTETTRPSNLPFYCHDITPRDNRVNGETEHPCGAVGIREVLALVDDVQNDAFAGLIRASVNSDDKEQINRSGVLVGTPHGAPSVISFIIPTTDAEKDEARLHKFVLKELKFDHGSSDISTGITFSYPFQA